MNTLLSTVTAATHPARYGLHKYWSRKPHNVLSGFIADLLPQNGVVVDPFVGSGVSAREASHLGHEVYAGDINPIAVLITKVTANPPDVDEFSLVLREAIDKLDNIVGPYWTERDRVIRYVVHAAITCCPSCQSTFAASDTVKRGRSRLCPKCDTSLSFNLETMSGTRAVYVAYEGCKQLDESPDVLSHQDSLSNQWWGGDRQGPLFEPLPVNRRILAFPDMTPASLFTPRALSTLVSFRDMITTFDNSELRDAGLLLLTGASAQCSRLIAYRNNLSTGGPAWSVPGFWVPPLHLETNPLIHIRARLKRFVKGLRDMKRHSSRGRIHVFELTARDLLANLASQQTTADLVILDPPYGDSVPFVEFSAFWNALLDREIDVDRDCSVSDRLGRTEAWATYENELVDVVKMAANVLSKKGKVLVTFNNNDERAWRVLLTATQGAGLACCSAKYQLPAVVSSKAAFSPASSYIGDIWAVLERQQPKWHPSRDLQPAIDAIATAAAFRGGKIPLALVRRTLALAWLSNNIDAGLVDQWPAIIDSMFENGKTQVLSYTGSQPPNVPNIDNHLLEIATTRLKAGPCSWNELVTAVANECAPYGVPDAAEVRAILTPHLVTQGDNVLTTDSFANEQPRLF
jgi:DNA-binding MarR family transcriptional regulator